MVLASGIVKTIFEWGFNHRVVWVCSKNGSVEKISIFYLLCVQRVLLPLYFVLLLRLIVIGSIWEAEVLFKQGEHAGWGTGLLEQVKDIDWGATLRSKAARAGAKSLLFSWSFLYLTDPSSGRYK